MDYINYLWQNAPIMVTSLLAVCSFITYKRFDEIRPNKNFSLDDIEKSLRFKKIEELIINPSIKERYLDSVKLFSEVVRKNSSFDLNNLYRNMRNLEIRPSLNNFLYGSTGCYLIDLNIIETCYLDYLRSIYHELFHMLSTIVTDDVIFSGFSLKIPSKKLDIGNGINEGYTELLNLRYFKDHIALKDKEFKLEVFLAKELELIVEQDEMERLYSLGSLEGLVNVLRNYNTDIEIKNFIYKMDILLSYSILDDKAVAFFKKGQNLIKEITDFLIVTYARKMDLKVKNKEISEELYQSMVKKYIQEISLALKYFLNITIEDDTLKLRKTTY